MSEIEMPKTQSPYEEREPPAEIVRLAIETAIESPCAKSKRGAVIWNAQNGIVVARAFNGSPDGTCDNSPDCRLACPKRCVHAETRAIRRAQLDDHDAPRYELLHVKAFEGDLSAGGGPSCWQCSREVLDAGIAGVWLYEEVGVMALNLGDGGPSRSAVVGGWRFYTARSFHQETLRHHGIYQVPR